MLFRKRPDRLFITMPPCARLDRADGAVHPVDPSLVYYGTDTASAA
jgi:hypothetical protein